jgi:Undecaprenyl-phosphate glucose phosphotransferase
MKHSKLVPSDQRYTSNVIRPITLIVDLLCLGLSAPLALAIYRDVVGERIITDVHVAASVIAGVTFFLIRQSQGAYSRPFGLLQRVDAAVLIDYAIAALLSSALIWQLGQLEEFSRGLWLIYVAVVCAALLLSRFLLQAWLLSLARRGKIGQRVVVYGPDDHILQKTCRLLRVQSLPHLTILGIASESGLKSAVDDCEHLGGMDDIVDLARHGDVDQVYIVDPQMTSPKLDRILEQLSVVSVDVSVIPSDIVNLAPVYRVALFGDLPVLTMWRRPIRDMDRLMKKFEDLIIATLALVALAPLLLITAIIIKATSNGPVLFVQPRFGFNNKVINVYKFRSMYVEQQDIGGELRTRRNDPRITPVGRIIRKLSIDELPQILNVLKGEMSIVGPRPHAIHMKVGDNFYLDAVRGYAARHRVKPGITGLAQVRGLRGEIQTIERAKRRVELDMHYIDNWSIGLDFRIILETVVGVIYDRNAY